jgi:hypothetical protein
MVGTVEPEFSLDRALVITPVAKGEWRKIISMSPPVVSPGPCSGSKGVSNPRRGVLSVMIRAVNMFNKQRSSQLSESKSFIQTFSMRKL